MKKFIKLLYIISLTLLLGVTRNVSAKTLADCYYSGEAVHIWLTEDNFGVNYESSITDSEGYYYEIKGHEITYNDLKNAYELNSSGCPTVYLSTDKKLFISTKSGLHKNIELTINKTKSTSAKSTGSSSGSTIDKFNNQGPRLDYDNICSDKDVKEAVILVGTFVNIAIYAIPFIIIVLGMVDFGKAVASSDEKAVSKATSSLIKRFVGGIAVALIPTLLIGLVNVMGLTDNETEDYDTCLNCLLHPFNDCKQ